VAQVQQLRTANHNVNLGTPSSYCVVRQALLPLHEPRVKAGSDRGFLDSLLIVANSGCPLRTNTLLLRRPQAFF